MPLNPPPPRSRLQKTSLAVALATALAIPAEGLRQFAYYDPPGILTVCYGSTTDVVKGVKYSLDECRKRLSADMITAVSAVERCHPGLPTNVLAAFGDAVYNIGPKIACDQKLSTAARLLAAKNYTLACQQLPRWDKASVAGIMVSLPGLTTRRSKEMGLCLTPEDASKATVSFSERGSWSPNFYRFS